MKQLRIAGVIALMLCTPSIVARTADAFAQAEFAPSPPDVEAFVRAALEDRMAAENLPDSGLLQGSRRIALLEEMPRAKMKLGPGALPKREGREFYLLSTVSAQSTADRTGSAVTFLTVDQPSIAEDTATITMGSDMILPQQPKAIKMCCCSGRAEFRRVAGRWTFQRWATMTCS